MLFPGMDGWGAGNWYGSKEGFGMCPDCMGVARPGTVDPGLIEGDLAGLV